MIRAFVLDGPILLTEVKILESTHFYYHKVISVLLQIVAEMVRNLVMASWLTYTVSRSWLGIFHMVGVVSYKMFAIVVTCKKEDGRKTIVDQRNVDMVKLQMLLSKLNTCSKSYQQRFEALIY